MTTTQNHNNLIALIPELDSPKAFDQWRVDVMRLAGTEQLLIAQHLKENHFHLGSLRAAMFLLSGNPQQSKFYSTHALQSSDKTVMLFAKAHLTNLIARENWYASAQPAFDMRPSYMVLENILLELKNIVPATPLVIEAITRVHLMLTDAYILTQKFDLSQLNAAEASILSSVLGLESLNRTARYQLASVALLEAQPESAAATVQTILDDPQADRFLATSAKEVLMLALDAQGDSDGMESLVAQDENPRFKQLLFANYRHPTIDELHLVQATQYRRSMCEAAQHVIAAQNTSPDQIEIIQNHYKKAVISMQAASQPAMGWYKNDAKIWGALFSYRSGSGSLAVLQAPSLSEVLELPIGKRIAALFILIECLEIGLPESGQDILKTINVLAEAFGQCEPRALEQLNAQAKLFTPFALALMSRFPGVPEKVMLAGDQCIVKLQSPTIRVYGSVGLRPITMLQNILESFGIFTEDKTRMGGGQIKGLHQALHHPYYQRTAWHQPIAAIRVAYALLCCCAVIENQNFKSMLIKSVHVLRTNWGYEPKLQKAKIPKAFKELVKTIKKLELHETTPSAAALVIAKLGGDDV